MIDQEPKLLKSSSRPHLKPSKHLNNTSSSLNMTKMKTLSWLISNSLDNKYHQSIKRPNIVLSVGNDLQISNLTDKKALNLHATLTRLKNKSRDRYQAKRIKARKKRKREEYIKNQNLAETLKEPNNLVNESFLKEPNNLVNEDITVINNEESSSGINKDDNTVINNEESSSGINKDDNTVINNEESSSGINKDNNTVINNEESSSGINKDDNTVINNDKSSSGINKDNNTVINNEESSSGINKDNNTVTTDNANSIKKDEVEMPYIGFHKYNSSTVIGAFSCTKIFLTGFYKVKLLLGSISVFGYTFFVGEEQPIYSPASHLILAIDVLCVDDIKSVKHPKIPLHWIPEKQRDSVALVLIKRLKSSLTKLLLERRIFHPFSMKKKPSILDQVLDVTFIEDKETRDVYLYDEPTEWVNLVESLQPLLASKTRMRIVITGGSNVGKSTFVKFLINRFLNLPCIRKVACLDLDPGQPEFSLPTCLSLLIINSPLLGPSFSHIGKSLFYRKEILLGDTFVQHVLKEYLDITQFLMSVYEKMESSLPLIVNTMGYTSSTGYDLMVDTLRIIQPTHVVNLRSYNIKKNFLLPLESAEISTTKRGITGTLGGAVNYDLVRLTSVSKTAGKESGKGLRDLSVMAYLSKLWDKKAVALSAETLKPPVIIDWATVAIYVQGTFVPQSHILQVINASLIALCQIEEEFLERTSSILPLQIQSESLWTTSCQVLGWGVVRGIDPEARQIHLLTPLDAKAIRKVNLLALSKIQPPSQFYSLFNSDINAPYFDVNKNTEENKKLSQEEPQKSVETEAEINT